MKIYYNIIFPIMVLVILMSIQYSINKIITILKEIKSILIELRIKDRF